MTKKSAIGMMRIAIAGGGGFAALLAQALFRSAHAVLVLSRMVRLLTCDPGEQLLTSRQPHPEFESNYDCQVAVVDYHNLESLQFFLQGVDLVISTISGAEQLNLIDAARRARVRTFVPSEFEGSLGHRPAPGSDPFDNSSSAALEQLRHWSSSRHYSMKYTVFSCGVFYERFAPGGLRAYNMGTTCRVPNQGDYLFDIGLGTGEYPVTNNQGRPIQISMTSAVDVARFVAAAIELGTSNWPREFKMRGECITPQRIHQYCNEVRQGMFI